MERMYDVMNVREAELKEVIKINHEEIAYWKNKANNAEEELDQVKRENKGLEEENKRLREKISKKNMKTWFDKKANNMFMEEDTLQELRDLGEI